MPPSESSRRIGALPVSQSSMCGATPLDPSPDRWFTALLHFPLRRHARDHWLFHAAVKPDGGEIQPVAIERPKGAAAFGLGERETEAATVSFRL
jgi:hypothetical protein